MNEQLEKIHNEAMEFSDQADAFRRDKDTASARALYRKAMEKEREAALGYRTLSDAKPATVGILLRSAATLARDAGETREAERLISLALSAEDVPPYVATELRDLLEEVNFQRHLELRNVQLTEQEVQMSLIGDAVSFGMVQSDEFLDRSEALQDIFYRTAEWQAGQPYRKHGFVAPAVRNQFAVYLSAFRGGSFAVTYRIGTQKEMEPSLPLDAPDESDRIDAAAVMDEVINNLRLFEEQNEQELEKQINGAYLKNFLDQARRIAPDGKRIKQVGLTTQRQSGSITPLALRRVVERQTRQVKPRVVVYKGRIIEIREHQKNDAVLIVLDTEDGQRITASTPNGDKASELFQKQVRMEVEKQKQGPVVQKVTLI